MTCGQLSRSVAPGRSSARCARPCSPAPRGFTRIRHIPGSLNAPHTALHDASGRYLRGAALAEALGPILTAPGPLVLYCGGGVSACSVALALTLFGRNDVAVYDGSLSEWAADPALPMTTIV